MLNYMLCRIWRWNWFFIPDDMHQKPSADCEKWRSRTGDQNYADIPSKTVSKSTQNPNKFNRKYTKLIPRNAARRILIYVPLPEMGACAKYFIYAMSHREIVRQSRFLGHPYCRNVSDIGKDQSLKILHWSGSRKHTCPMGGASQWRLPFWTKSYIAVVIGTPDATANAIGIRHHVGKCNGNALVDPTAKAMKRRWHVGKCNGNALPAFLLLWHVVAVVVLAKLGLRLASTPQYIEHSDCAERKFVGMEDAIDASPYLGPWAFGHAADLGELDSSVVHQREG